VRSIFSVSPARRVLLAAGADDCIHGETLKIDAGTATVAARSADFVVPGRDQKDSTGLSFASHIACLRASRAAQTSEKPPDALNLKSVTGMGGRGNGTFYISPCLPAEKIVDRGTVKALSPCAGL